jgi:hypothetical protein
MLFRTKDCPIAIGFAFVLLVNSAQATESARCYQWTTHLNNPERTVPLRPSQDTIVQTWCYELHVIGGRAMAYVYNTDLGEVRPELAELVELDSSGKPTAVTHGSLSHGQISFHRMTGYVLNPFPAPLTIEEAKGLGRTKHAEFDFNVQASAANVLNALVAHADDTAGITLKPGKFDSYLPASALPWRGYWWARGTLEDPDNGPLTLYDSIVKNWTGKDPQSRVWEAANHSSSDLSWTGHCNGWAASALLYSEPNKDLWDPIGNRTVHPGDIKGMLAESSFCAQYAFYGNRYWGNPGDRLEDIDPWIFHQVLVYYIDGLKKPVAMDYERDVEVDNHIITGYHMDIKPISGHPHSYNITADLRVHKYDDDYDPESVGEPDSYTRTYTYELDTDASGNIINGHWTGDDNPDFLWVPIAAARCGWTNPYVDQAMIDRIRSEFKPKTTVSDSAVETHEGELR